MIGKCVLFLAIVAQIYGQVCTCGSLSAGVGTRNVVTKGKYPVALEHTGPCVDPRVPVSSSHVQAPLEVKPTVRLPFEIPAPRTVSHTCTCYKSVMRPRVHNQYITVPSVQRYVETVHKPVVENIHYEGVPVNDNDSVLGNGLVSSGSVVGGSFGSETTMVRVAPVAVAPLTVTPVATQVAVAPVATARVAVAPVATTRYTVTPVQVRNVETLNGCVF